jgi:hypothetical protein
MRMGLAMPAANMQTASANPQPEDDAPKMREKRPKKAADEDGTDETEAPEKFCSHCTRLLKHNGGRNAIASAHTRMSIDLRCMKFKTRAASHTATSCSGTWRYPIGSSSAARTIFVNASTLSPEGTACCRRCLRGQRVPCLFEE